MTSRHLLRLTSFLMLLLLTAPLSFAQPNTDPYNFDDVPVDAAGRIYIAIGGGYLGVLSFADHTELNKVADTLGLSHISGPMLLNGGGGFSSLLIIDNVRVGVYGLGGSKSTQKDTLINGTTFTRSLKFSQSVTGLQFDYAIRLSRDFTLLPGVMVGANDYTMEVTQSNSNGEPLGSIIPGQEGSSFNSRINNSSLYYNAGINLEWVPFRLMMLRAGAGYNGVLAASWSDANGTTVSGVPEVSTNGLSVQFGLFVGVFQFK